VLILLITLERLRTLHPTLQGQRHDLFMPRVEWRRPDAKFGGDGKDFRGPRFLKISIFTPKISDDFFLVIDQVFQILCFFTVLSVVYDPFFTRKITISDKNSLRPLFTLFVLSRASDNTASLNIGGTNAWVVPHLKFWGDCPPSPP